MKTKAFLVVLYLYHLLFIFLSYSFAVNHKEDAYLYWFYTNYTLHKPWTAFFNFGTDFILFLNYPFVKIGTPFFIGFLIYGTIGFFGILKWMKWSVLVFGENLYFKNVNFIAVICFLPNLHFWTASLGKEPIIFWSVSAIFYAVASRKFLSFSFIIGSLLLVIIRPHVAAMLILSIILVLIFNRKESFKSKIISLFGSFVVFLVLVFMALQLSNIKYLNLERIRFFNEYSILSLKNSGSYIPMLEYNYCYKFFSFYFRPLFFDAHTVWMYFASIENGFVLLLFFAALLSTILFLRKKVYPEWLKIVFLFTFISGFIYIHRYANLGLFMRTKVMFQPFFIIALLYLIKQGLLVNFSRLKLKNGIK
jgi:hypothetical protein